MTCPKCSWNDPDTVGAFEIRARLAPRNTIDMHIWQYFSTSFCSRAARAGVASSWCAKRARCFATLPRAGACIYRAHGVVSNGS